MRRRPAARPRSGAAGSGGRPVGGRRPGSRRRSRCRGARRRLPAAPPVVRTVRALQRESPIRKGLRGVDRVLRALRRAARRRRPGADGRQADGDPGRTVHPLRRHPRGVRSVGSVRRRHGRAGPGPRRRPLPARSGSVCGRHAGAGERAQRGADGPLPAQQRGSVLRRRRRVRRVPAAAGEQRRAAGEDGPERPALRRGAV